jgi:hypothetical protein
MGEYQVLRGRYTYINLPDVEDFAIANEALAKILLHCGP